MYEVNFKGSGRAHDNYFQFLMFLSVSEVLNTDAVGPGVLSLRGMVAGRAGGALFATTGRSMLELESLEKTSFGSPVSNFSSFPVPLRTTTGNVRVQQTMLNFAIDFAITHDRDCDPKLLV